MSTFAEYKSKLKHPQQLAHFELIAAALSLSGFCPQGRLIEICRQSGYSKKNTIDLITRLAGYGLVELSVTKESPQVNVAVCDDADLQGVLV